MTYWQYRERVEQEMYQIVTVQGIDIADLHKKVKLIEREAVSRLYVQGIFHDLGMKYPNGDVQLKCIGV